MTHLPLVLNGLLVALPVGLAEAGGAPGRRGKGRGGGGERARSGAGARGGRAERPPQRSAAGAAMGLSVVGIWAGFRMYICILSALFQGLWRRYYHGDAWAGRPAIYNWCMYQNFPGRYLTPVRLHFEGEKPDLDSAIWVSMHFTILDWVFCVCGNDQISFCAGMKPFAFGLSLGHLLYFPLVAAHYFDGRNILLPASQGYKGFERWIAKTKHPWVYPAGLGTRFRSGTFRAAMATGKP